MLTVCSDGRSATNSIRLAMLGPQRPAAGKNCIRCAHADLTTQMLLKDKEEHPTHTVFVLQLVLLEGVAADGGYDIQSIQALSWLRLAHLALRQGTYMFVALQQVSQVSVSELHVHKT